MIYEEDLLYFLEILYHSNHIPVYLFRHGTLMRSYPDTDRLPLLFQSPLDLLSETNADLNQKIGIHMSKNILLFGHISHPDSGDLFIVGPVTSLSLSEKLLDIIRHFYGINASDRDVFTEYLKRLPVISSTQLHYTLLHMYYAVYHERIDNNIVMTKEPTEDRETITSDYFDNLETGKLYHSYESEDDYLHRIESGDINFIHSKKRLHISHAETAFTPLRNIQNSAVILLTLFPRAAIRGGLSEQIAFTMSDYYIKQSELAASPKEVDEIIEKAYADFIECVHNHNDMASLNSVLRECNTFIRNNVNRKISTMELAEMFGYSRAHFSTIYKKEFGISPGAYIMHCKLDAAKRMLTYSDRPISEISNYLCFSNQSHFQRSFKEAFGVTPHVYRKTAGK